MNRATVEEHALLGRVERLEKKTRWLAALAMTLSLLCVALLAWQFAPIEPAVESRHFVLRDAHWRVRAELKARQDDTPILRLMDRAGRASAMLFLDDAGAVALRLMDPRGHERAELSLDREGAPALVLSGENGRPRVTVTADDDGEAGGQSLVLRDRYGRSVWSTPGSVPARD